MTELDTLIVFAQDADVAAGIFMLVCVGFGVILTVALIGFQIWMLVDCIQHESKHPDNQLVVWILVILLIGWIGALIYYCMRKNKNRVVAQQQQFQQPFPPQNKQF